MLLAPISDVSITHFCCFPHPFISTRKTAKAPKVESRKPIIRDARHRKSIQHRRNEILYNMYGELHGTFGIAAHRWFSNGERPHGSPVVRLRFSVSCMAEMLLKRHDSKQKPSKNISPTTRAAATATLSLKNARIPHHSNIFSSRPGPKKIKHD
jgi:hypothetical protein